MNADFKFAREYWTGDSRDGKCENSDGYHYYRMTPAGLIVEAYEVYEKDDGTQVVSPLPEMQNVDWIKDLGFEDFDALDAVTERDFLSIREQLTKQ